ncbi:unnamed protein product [Arabis nemorensis]|uniref:Uncharacterized protein n=1 Tax=Arabis nemorensis TaxID=586526 RepID=A0A565CS71_9BRAS|nr:unnamed protein product [Arabis nemorensis]
MATNRRRNEEIETQIRELPRKESERSFEAVSESDKEAERSTPARDNKTHSKQSPNLTRDQKKVRDSYLFCCENFYTLPEMVNYMKENHGLPKTSVTNVFRELLKGRNAEAYLRVSQKRSLQRLALQRRTSGSGVGSSTK